MTFSYSFFVEKLFRFICQSVKWNFATVGHPWKNAFGHHLEKSTTSTLEKILPTPMRQHTTKKFTDGNGFNILFERSTIANYPARNLCGYEQQQRDLQTGAQWGWQAGHNSPGVESLWRRWITAGSAEKYSTMSQVLSVVTSTQQCHKY